MPRRPHATAVALLVILLGRPAPAARVDDPVASARALLAQGDPRAAVRLLEDALPGADRAALPALIETLRDAYTKAIERAAGEGKPAEADRFREGLGLLGPSRPVPPPAAPKPAPEMPRSEPVPAPTDPKVGPQPEPGPAPPAPLMPTPDPVDPAPVIMPSPAPVAAPPADELAARLEVGDRAWKEKRYADAGAAYAALAEGHRLPPGRRDHWAYCRLVGVLERINAQPRSPAEWAAIHAEIDHIRLLSPKNWYSVYLRNVVVERSGGVKPADPSKVVLRGSDPDDAPAPKPSAPVLAPRKPPQTRPASRPGRPVPAPAAAPAPAPAPVAPSAPKAEAEVGRPGPVVGRWKTFVTPNFRILHDDEALARQVATRAEAARREAARRWTGAEPRGAWTPACDLYLYPTAAIFASETQQSPESPGFSTAGLSGGRVTARLVKLRADYPKMLDAVLPHEVTHVVLADLFPTAQIPRWADEGMAVLSEPAEEQALRVRDLAEPLRQDVLFGLDVLMTADYPGGSHWALYYAQSVSVTRYLAGLGTAPQFVQFVRMAQAEGPDAAVRKAYRIDGLAELERRWKAHAREAANPAVASSGTDSLPPGDATRR